LSAKIKKRPFMAAQLKQGAFFLNAKIK